MAPAHSLDTVSAVNPFAKLDSSRTHRRNSSTVSPSDPVPYSEQHSSRSSISQPFATNTTAARRPSNARTLSAPNVSPGKTRSSYISFDDEEEAYSFRDSVTSIKDDPFFRNYQNPQSVSLAQELRSVGYRSVARSDGQMNSPVYGHNKNLGSSGVHNTNVSSTFVFWYTRPSS